MDQLKKFLSGIDVSEAFKTKGDLKRWSAKRTIGGLIAGTACYSITEHGMSWEAVAMCGIAVVPLCLSLWEDIQPSEPTSDDEANS